MAVACNDQELQAVADMIAITFFFLLRPVEYTGTKSDSSPFCLSDVTFSVGCTVFDTATATDNELAAAAFVILVFTMQKSGVWGEKNSPLGLRRPPIVPRGGIAATGGPPTTTWRPYVHPSCPF